MRNALCLVIGICLGASAATAVGQPRDIVSLNHVAVVARLRARGMNVGDASVSARTKSRIAVARTPDGTTIELMEFGPESLHRKVINAWSR
jgi:hypothetical protein